MTPAQRQRAYRQRSARTVSAGELHALSVSQLVTKLQKTVQWMQSAENNRPALTQRVVADVLDELRRRLVELPV